MKKLLLMVIPLLMVCGCIKKAEDNKDSQTDSLSTAQAPTIFEGEKHFTNLKQLTFGGQNAEAYFSYDGSELIFQAMTGKMECDAIFRMNADGSNVRPISNGKGATTCSFISPDGQKVVYASTHLAGEECPPRPDMSQGYVWALYESYDIFQADPDGSNIVRLTDTEGYDAEAVYSPMGDKIIFTSVRSGDLELWIMDPDGTNLKQITDMPGYDGGAFFSLDGKSICWRASRPEGDELADYQRLLGQGLIRPSKLEIYIMNLDDMKPIQLTNNSAANFGPYFSPDQSRVIFCSNMDDPTKRNFDLYLVNVETKEIERVTYNETFDGFPMFSHDGKKFVFASNRNNNKKGETNIFIADWVW
ncbi:MAG: hypothetical protein P1R58_05995 [bacterium]|nr:hypothetical protein [bacterium]